MGRVAGGFAAGDWEVSVTASACHPAYALVTEV
jgi:hypothetical protein